MVIVLSTVLVCIILIVVVLSQTFSDSSVKLQVNDSFVDVAPLVSSPSNSSGSYLDGLITGVPCLHTENGAKVTLSFINNPPRTTAILKYDVYDTAVPLGAITTQGTPERIDSDYMSGMLSFVVDYKSAPLQLVICDCQWNSILGVKNSQYVFLVSNT